MASHRRLIPGWKAKHLCGKAKQECEAKQNEKPFVAVLDARGGSVYDWGVFLSCFKFINLLINLFMAALGLRCCVRAFSSCGEQGLLFVAVHGLLIVVASLVAEHGL